MSDLVVRAAEVNDDVDAVMAGDDSWPGFERVLALSAGGPDGESVLLAAVLGEELVGYAEVLGFVRGGGFRPRAGVRVVENARDRGVGSALWSRLLAEAPQSKVFVSVDSADERSLAIARAHTTAELGIRLTSVLDLRSLSNEQLAGALNRSRTLAVEFTEPDDLNDPAQFASIYAAYVSASRDTPDGRAGRPPMSASLFRSRLPSEWQILTAQHEGQIVAITTVIVRDSQQSRVNTVITGVDAAVRGHGLSTVIKAEHARRLRDRGWRELITQNLSTNRAILAANERIGFTVTSARHELAHDRPCEADSA